MRRFKTMINWLWHSEFLRGVLLLSSGSAVSQLAVFLASPVLSRLYGVEAFGDYALFSSAVNLLTQIACLKFDMALSVCSDEKRADGLLQLSVLSSAGICFLSLLGLPLAGRMGSLQGGRADWVYLLPVSILLTGLHAALSGYNLRLERYGRITAAAISRGAWMIVLQIGLGLLGFSVMGMALGQALSALAGCILLGKGVWKKLVRIEKPFLRATAKSYGGFPRYTAIGSAANALTYNLVSFLLAVFYSPSQLGQYSLATKILSAPLTIFVNAVGQIFLRRSAREKEGSGNSAAAFRKVSAGLILAASGLFGGLYLLLPQAIRLVYGEQWQQSGIYARILLPLYLARFVVTPLSSSAIVHNRLSQTMGWQIGLLCISFLPAAIRLIAPVAIETYLTLMSGGLTAGYLLFYLYCRNSQKGEVKLT